MSNDQPNPNFQNPKTKDLGIGAWDFIGHWDLDIGAFKN
jgi:hypothetical protein